MVALLGTSPNPTHVTCSDGPVGKQVPNRPATPYVPQLCLFIGIWFPRYDPSYFFSLSPLSHILVPRLVTRRKPHGGPDRPRSSPDRWRQIYFRNEVSEGGAVRSNLFALACIRASTVSRGYRQWMTVGSIVVNPSSSAKLVCSPGRDHGSERHQ